MFGECDDAVDRLVVETVGRFLVKATGRLVVDECFVSWSGHRMLKYLL